MLRKLKWQIPAEPLAARYNWCQGAVPGRGPAVEKHWPTWSRVLPKKLPRRQLVKKRTTDSGGSLPHSQTPTLRQNKVHASPSHFLKIQFNIILHLHQGFPSGLFPSGLIKTLYSHLLYSIRATCPTHLILLDLITQIFGEEWKSWSCL
jgi:hypothetical protein